MAGVGLGLSALVCACVAAACHAPPAAPEAPANFGAILALTLSDATGDFVLAPQEGPPVVVPYPPTDLTSLRPGVDGQYLYVQANYAAAIPTTAVSIPAQQGMPAQTVREQGVSFNFNSE